MAVLGRYMTQSLALDSRLTDDYAAIFILLVKSYQFFPQLCSSLKKEQSYIILLFIFGHGLSLGSDSFMYYSCTTIFLCNPFTVLALA